jgi:hypothetical protein
MKTIIKGVTYTAHTRKKDNGYYPLIKFFGAKISDEFWINDPQSTRTKARTIATNYIKNLKE